jgi:pimeloyl-ACP methyl ester carboxylesterase
MTQIAVGSQIYQYEVVGAESKLTPVLILHGWGRTGTEWVAVAKKINEWSGRQVYILDLPGFRGSGIPQVKSMEEYTETVNKFCKYLALKKVIVIGHSLGGRVGIIMAAKNEWVDKLILVDPAGVKPKSIKRRILRTLAFIFGWIPKEWRRALVSPMMDGDYHSSPALRELYRALVAKDLRAYLPQIKCPTTIVWGERDPILPLSLTQIYRRAIPDSRVRVVWGAGHDPHLTKFEQTVAILQEATE